MKNQVLFLASLLLISENTISQINFENYDGKSARTHRFQDADSAILAGEFGEVHSLLVVEKGNLIFEKYYNGWNKDSLHQLQSVTKSIIATLFGCALQQGFISGVHEKIENYYLPYIEKDPQKRNITIDNLLTQRHGLISKEFPFDDPDNTWRKIYSSEGNWYQKILETSLDTTPGSFFNYGNLAPVLISGIVQTASKMKIDSFATKFLFKPLQIDNYRFWNANGGPANNGMAMLHLTARDMAKIGQLYLQKGKWNNNQIIPEDFVRSAVSSRVSNVEPNGVYSGYDYGYFWWSNPVWRNKQCRSTEKIFLARGAGGQNIVVDPETERVVVITAWNIQRSNKPQEIFDKYILCI